MANEQKEFWSTVAQKYDRVVDLQIGGKTRSMVRERVMKEGQLDALAKFGCGTGPVLPECTLTHMNLVHILLPVLYGYFSAT